MVSDSKSVLFHRDWLDSLTIYCHPFDYVHKGFDWWHHHNFDELVIVRSGEGLHVTENGTYRIHKGDTFMIKKGNFHSYKELQNLRIINFAFHREYWLDKCREFEHSPIYAAFFENSVNFKEDFTFEHRLTLSEELLLECELCFPQMILEQTGNAIGCRSMNEVLFMRLVITLCRKFSKQKRCSSEISDLNRLLKFIKENHSSPLRLKDLAAKSNQSNASLNRLFHKAMGTSPMEYLNTIRLEAAAADLRKTDETISSIAAAHGFSDSNYFSFRFFKSFGSSPSKYRAEHRKSSEKLQES